jgi:hypothetical protein
MDLSDAFEPTTLTRTVEELGTSRSRIHRIEKASRIPVTADDESARSYQCVQSCKDDVVDPRTMGRRARRGRNVQAPELRLGRSPGYGVNARNQYVRTIWQCCLGKGEVAAKRM